MVEKSILLTALFLLLIGCAHQVGLPTAPSSPLATCGLKVIDERPDPEALYIRATQAITRVTIEPPLSESIRTNACHALSPSSSIATSKFIVTDYECTVTGFFEIRYVIDIKGRLDESGEQSVEIRSGNVYLSSEGYVPKGCERASAQAILELSSKIARALR